VSGGHGGGIGNREDEELVARMIASGHVKKVRTNKVRSENEMNGPGWLLGRLVQVRRDNTRSFLLVLFLSYGEQDGKG